jgi:hypothetical protein
MKRQRSRNRGGGSGGNTGKPQQNANRAFESNGPDGVKIRGAAQHVFEKYQQLARDALTAGDRVLAESYQQHAEHYFRVLRAVQPNRPASDIIGRDAFASGFDIDFEDESGEQAEGAAENAEADSGGESRGEWRRDERPRDAQRDPQRDGQRDGQGGGGQRDDRPQRDRSFNRDDRPRNEGYRGDQPREDRPQRNFNRDERPRDERPRDERPRDERPRDERPRDDRPRDDRPRDSQRFDRGDRVERTERADPLAVVEPRASPLTVEAETKSSPVLRSHDGGVSQAPAFLQAQPRTEAPVAESVEAAPRPRRRRVSPKDADTSPLVSPEEA